ncbi:MAG: 3-isopropylmalate dehydratase small subunit [Anaerolineae bacterium]|nr:3-isopropylmalate dehydratase small subunit [Anaerolineae bacterium]
MAQFTKLTSKIMPLLVDNIDTDQIIPARFLKVTDKEGLGKVLFCDWRYEGTVSTIDAAEQATPKADFILNNPRYEGAQILLVGDNFGCGSSREHAPWALTAHGFRAVISTSFADIFYNNALKNGLLPVVVDAETHADLLDMAEETTEAFLTIDLESQSVELPGGQAVSFPIDAFARSCLLRGVDQLGYLLSFDEQITAYEEATRV